jgi:hypothetical protein
MSVHQREPVKAGPYHSEEVKTAFLTWARENLSAKHVAEIEAIQRTYKDAATAAGF